MKEKLNRSGELEKLVDQRLLVAFQAKKDTTNSLISHNYHRVTSYLKTAHVVMCQGLKVSLKSLQSIVKHEVL